MSQQAVVVFELHILPGAEPGFLERGFICIKVWGLPLLILSNFT